MSDPAFEALKEELDRLPPHIQRKFRNFMCFCPPELKELHGMRLIIDAYRAGYEKHQEEVAASHE